MDAAVPSSAVGPTGLPGHGGRCVVLSEMAPPPPSGAFLQPPTKFFQATATLVAQHSMGLSPQHCSAPGRGLSRPFHPPSPSVSLIMPRPASTTAARVISSKSPRAALLISRQELGSVAAVLQHGRLPRGRRGGSGSRAPLQKPRCSSRKRRARGFAATSLLLPGAQHGAVVAVGAAAAVP